MQRHALSLLQVLCIFSAVPRILGLRAPRQSEDVHGRNWQILGAQEFPAGCVDVSLQLGGPLHEYTTLISHSAGINANVDEAACLLTAEHGSQGSSDDGQIQCVSHVWDLRGAHGAEEPVQQQIRIQSRCNAGATGLQVMKNDAFPKHRRLADSSNLLANATAVNQTSPAVPTPGAGNSQGPNSGVACCCGQNNQVGGSSQCCCGPVSICCQASGFCMTQNCTAIFVGSTLIAGAVISFMTCGICIYRARTSLREPASRWAMNGGRLREHGSRLPRRPLPTHGPPAEEEGNVRECPVCLEEVTSNAQWLIFNCHHATCRACYEQLVAKPHQDAVCPLCRALLTEIVPEEASPQVAIQLQPLQREPAGPLGGQGAAHAAPQMPPAQ